MMKFLTNIPDPNTEYPIVFCAYGETEDEALSRQRQWLRGKIMGKPQATEWRSVDELRAMGVVGVYLPDEQ